jgi:hypothetical protein
MQTISNNDLDSVYGGTTPTKADLPTNGGGSSSSGGCHNDQLLTAIQGIQSSLKDIGKNNNQGLFGNNGLLFLGMALAMQRRSESVVCVGGGCGRGGYGYSYRTSWY